ncbi:uncharacterized protein PpBr36_09462 [Pyricularia pennisetigena]|uniref:uncharacterized protein n=1 Tax=Pyricularia pennisetigena TaxID=1578925 RepID=UPI0011528AA4|nr:uncharacterized protein PpBr36_09462 [Pyricularia pennisetigena]TLS21971.1 hypothetical protein PpBr36_09462 [Pyricularia pennisetigena]
MASSFHRAKAQPSGGGVRNLKGMMGSRICSQPPGARLDMADSMTARGERKHVTTARMWIKSKGNEKSHSSSASQIWKEQFGGTYVGWMGDSPAVFYNVLV